MICQRSIECGCPVLLNGSWRGINGTRKQTFACCFKHRMHRGINKENLSLYRVDTIVNSDKKGRRIDGRKKSHRTTTTSSNVVGKCYNFCFHLNFDNYGYYIEKCTGWPNHCNHPKVNPDNLPMPSRLLAKFEIENIIALYESCAGTGVTRNFLMTKYGRFFSKSSIAYSGSSSQISNKHIKHSDVENLLQSFKDSKKISYQVLWDVPIDSIEEEGFSTEYNNMVTPVKNLKKIWN